MGLAYDLLECGRPHPHRQWGRGGNRRVRPDIIAGQVEQAVGHRSGLPRVSSEHARSQQPTRDLDIGQCLLGP